MSSLAATRASIVSAIGAKDDVADPPCALVFSQGVDLASALGDGSMLWRFRVTLLVPANSDLGGGDVAMNAYIATQLAILYGVVGLRVESVGPTGVAQWAGSDVLAADIAVSTYVQLA